ncbi:hypothetical protein GMOD_00006468 [Pyrenophora seminiperda CCB06]|uniref:Uncharacterized protein n=1 Tax=Pyrenophora seminiperda CCB06 TaxID=1302712 RepID=A0A3M7M5E5_9PLEO|nr:hypothetical protein GMOD_00006468 [Pyrenophora seminiperda CCB06]
MGLSQDLSDTRLLSSKLAWMCDIDMNILASSGPSYHTTLELFDLLRLQRPRPDPNDFLCSRADIHRRRKAFFVLKHLIMAAIIVMW